MIIVCALDNSTLTYNIQIYKNGHVRTVPTPGKPIGLYYHYPYLFYGNTLDRHLHSITLTTPTLTVNRLDGRYKHIHGNRYDILGGIMDRRGKDVMYVDWSEYGMIWNIGYIDTGVEGIRCRVVKDCGVLYPESVCCVEDTVYALGAQGTVTELKGGESAESLKPTRVIHLCEAARKQHQAWLNGTPEPMIMRRNYGDYNVMSCIGNMLIIGHPGKIYLMDRLKMEIITSAPTVPPDTVPCEIMPILMRAGKRSIVCVKNYLDGSMLFYLYQPDGLQYVGKHKSTGQIHTAVYLGGDYIGILGKGKALEVLKVSKTSKLSLSQPTP